ncbi:predicted protein [Plenodomus lingam JN3]|uniref:Predicted protein n=1 Tax=Leptosphaeria maculans (strain JN3 / isolate v23.1.3 / race Av1-4-5-6-7-8) TaxID=985895 RepID=E5A9M8_LEPMJ|nr:predicted protein [Plenodomus lingam JN3]CBY00369.1 predicted protein [Plenodomus lingam JN3]
MALRHHGSMHAKAHFRVQESDQIVFAIRRRLSDAATGCDALIEAIHAQ